MIARVGPGARLLDTTNPLLVLEAGRPVLASATIGSGLHEVAFQNLISVLDFGMEPKVAVEQPNTQGMYHGMGLNTTGKPEYEKEAISGGAFPQTVLDGVEARGQPIKIVEKYTQPGYWIGIQIERSTGTLRGGVTSLLPALVEAY
jgi:gamma-glutamyltranspeptidase / glutathione hydrolase